MSLSDSKKGESLMPYKDPKKRLEATKKWRTRAMASGYGKALYSRRAARYRNEEILRARIELALKALDNGSPKVARKVLALALEEAPPIGPPSEYMPEAGMDGPIASGTE
jgi:hypothetical protein